MFKIQKPNPLFLCFSVSLILFLSRILPHAPNFTATSAGILFCIAMIRKWYFIPFLIIAYLLADVALNNLVYAEAHLVWMSKGFYWILFTYAVIGIMAGKVFKQSISPLNVLGASFGSSIIFYLISNFGVWFGSLQYTQDLTGLIGCYIAALPFFAYELCGTLFYSSLLFGSYWLLEFTDHRSIEKSRN